MSRWCSGVGLFLDGSTLERSWCVAMGFIRFTSFQVVGLVLCHIIHTLYTVHIKMSIPRLNLIDTAGKIIIQAD